MPTIVRYINKKNGKVYLYESTPKYDPQTKQARPIRKYLGREDPITGELIPSSKKPGRPKSERASGEEKETTEESVRALRVRCSLIEEQLKKADKRLTSYKEETDAMKHQIATMEKIIRSIHNATTSYETTETRP